VQELAKRLCEAFGVSGFEDDVRRAIQREIAGLADSVSVDTLGNLIALRRGAGGGKRVMLAAHMDQIGVIVTHVDEKGFLWFAPVGGLLPLALVGAQVRFADGTLGTVGLDGRKNPADSVPAMRDLYIDVGATEQAQVKQQVGDVASFWPGFAAQGATWFSPNLDDRAGCVALVELLRRVHGVALPHDLYVVFTTQEEVGTRGARTSGYALDPEVAIAIDVTATGDTPHVARAMDVSLGKGVAVKIKDAGMLSHPGLNRLLVAAADEYGIPYQREVLQGGTTDAYAIQVSRSGVPATALSLPSRHVHTPSQIVDERDVEATVKLLDVFLRRDIELP
jgi:endoglucanase